MQEKPKIQTFWFFTFFKNSYLNEKKIENKSEI